MKLTKNNYLKHAFLAVFLCTSLILVMIVTAWAFAQGYASQDQGLRPGMTVSLSQSSTAVTPQVERATQENLQKVIGIATNTDQNLVTVASGEHQAYVQSSGTVEAFVSDINGDPKNGDTLTISPIKGILMRANDSHRSIGTTLEDFAHDRAESQIIRTDNGQQRVLIAKLNISLANLLSDGQQLEAGDKSELEKLGEAVIGKDVSEFQVIAALVIFLVVMVAEGGIVYGAISSSIISLGRNPFSKNIIRTELMRVLALAVFVLLVGLASTYSILNI